MTHSRRWDQNKCVRIYTQWIFQVTWNLASATCVPFLHGYTYMAGDTKLSSREMLACRCSWLDASKLFPRRPSVAPRTRAAPPFRAPEVLSSRFWSDRNRHICPHDFRLKSDDKSQSMQNRAHKKQHCFLLLTVTGSILVGSQYTSLELRGATSVAMGGSDGLFSYINTRQSRV